MLKHTLRRILLGACLLATALPTAAHAAERKPYSFVFFSNPAPGKEDQFLEWYTGQHIHDLLAIEGFKAAQFYKLTDTQFVGTHPQRYMMIWELETDDLPAVFERVNRGLKSGTTVLVGALDNPTANSSTFAPITRRVTAEEIRGMSPAQVRALATAGPS